jgi:hypothetical protein
LFVRISDSDIFHTFLEISANIPGLSASLPDIPHEIKVTEFDKIQVILYVIKIVLSSGYQ